MTSPVKDTNKILHQYIYDPDKMQFTTQVTKVTEENGKIVLELQESYFFPEAGGQPADRGVIDGVTVDFVENTVPIRHILPKDKEFVVGQKVECQISEQYRKENSRQHTGQHLLSAIAMDLFGADSTSFAIQEEMNTIEIDKKLTKEQVDQLEQKINERILEDHPILYKIYTEQSEIPDELRKNYNFVPLRVVSIEDIDSCPCCGTHVESTAQLGQCVIFSSKSVSGGSKIQFLFGMRCAMKMRSKYNILLQACDEFTCGDEILMSNITKSKKIVQQYKKQITDMTKHLLPDFVLKNAKEGCIELPFQCSQAEVNTVLKLLQSTNPVVKVLFTEDGKQSQLIITDKDQNVTDIVSQLKVASKIKEQGGNKQRAHLKFNGLIKIGDIM